MSKSDDGIAGCIGQLMGILLLGGIFFIVMKCQTDKDQEETKKEIKKYYARFDYDVEAVAKKVIDTYPNFNEKFRPFQFGKAILLDKSKESNTLYFNFNGGLSEEFTAFNKNELKYIIIREYSEEKVDMYNNNETVAARLNMDITILDAKTLEIISRKFVPGNDPPKSIRYRRHAPKSETGSVGMTIEEAFKSMAIDTSIIQN
jgi:hypothetical protein